MQQDQNDRLTAPLVVCPFCKSVLEYGVGLARCVRCGKNYPEKKGILCFGEHDAFYEGKFTKTREDWSFEKHFGINGLLKSLYRSISISAYENRFFSKTLDKIIPNNNALILDFGFKQDTERQKTLSPLEIFLVKIFYSFFRLFSICVFRTVHKALKKNTARFIPGTFGFIKDKYGINIQQSTSRK